MDNETKKLIIFGTVKADKYQAVCDIVIDGKVRFQVEREYGFKNELAYPVRQVEAKLADYERMLKVGVEKFTKEAIKAVEDKKKAREKKKQEEA